MRDLLIPDLGVDKAVVIELHKQQGDTLEEGELVALLETDKVTLELQATASGTLEALHIKLNDEVVKGFCYAQVSGSETEKTEETGEHPSTGSGGEPSTGSGNEPSTGSGNDPSTNSGGETSTSSEGTNEPQQVPIYLQNTGSPSVVVADIFVQVGQELEEAEVLFSAETDKVVLEIPCPYSGKLQSLEIQTGQSLKDGDLIGTILTSQEAQAEPESPKQEAPAMPAPQNQQIETQTKNEQPPPQQAPAMQASNEVGERIRVYAGPAVRKLAREYGVDLQKIQKASGLDGRITKEDLKFYVKDFLQKHAQDSQSSAPAGGMPIAQDPLPDFSQFGAIEELQLSRAQFKTAENLQKTCSIPSVTLFETVNIDALLGFRKLLAQQKDPQKVTLLAFIVKAVVKALMAYPQINSSLDLANKAVILKKYYNIGIAVDSNNDLLVPVLKNADSLGVLEIAEAIKTSVATIKSGKIHPSLFQGSCFSISNIGTFGSEFFTPLINPPEVAILGIGRQLNRNELSDDGKVVKSCFIPLSLSFDHRVVNGAYAAKFLGYLRDILESPMKQIL